MVDRRVWKWAGGLVAKTGDSKVVWSDILYEKSKEIPQAEKKADMMDVLKVSQMVVEKEKLMMAL